MVVSFAGCSGLSNQNGSSERLGSRSEKPKKNRHPEGQRLNVGRLLGLDRSDEGFDFIEVGKLGLHLRCLTLGAKLGALQHKLRLEKLRLG